MIVSGTMMMKMIAAQNVLKYEFEYVTKQEVYKLFVGRELSVICMKL